MIRQTLLVLSCLLALSGTSEAQQLAMNIQQVAPGITVTPMGSGELDFGQVFKGNSYTIPGNGGFGAGQVQVVAIEAQFHQEILIEVTPPPALGHQHNNDELPFTLRARHSTPDQVGWAQADFFQGSPSSGGTAISEVICVPNPGGNCNPKDKKPKKKKKGKRSTVYLYIGGDISVEQVSAGIYSGMINISVSYE